MTVLDDVKNTLRTMKIHLDFNQFCISAFLKRQLKNEGTTKIYKCKLVHFSLTKRLYFIPKILGLPESSVRFRMKQRAWLIRKVERGLKRRSFLLVLSETRSCTHGYRQSSFMPLYFVRIPTRKKCYRSV